MEVWGQEILPSRSLMYTKECINVHCSIALQSRSFERHPKTDRLERLVNTNDCFIFTAIAYWQVNMLHHPSRTVLHKTRHYLHICYGKAIICTFAMEEPLFAHLLWKILQHYFITSIINHIFLLIS